MHGCTYTTRTFHQVDPLPINKVTVTIHHSVHILFYFILFYSILLLWLRLNTVNPLACCINRSRSFKLVCHKALWLQMDGKRSAVMICGISIQPEFTKKLSPTLLNNVASNPKVLIQGRMALCLYQTILTFKCHGTNYDSTDQETFFQPVILQSWWSLRNCCPSSLLWADKSGTECGVLPLRG